MEKSILDRLSKLEAKIDSVILAIGIAPIIKLSSVLRELIPPEKFAPAASKDDEESIDETADAYTYYVIAKIPDKNNLSDADVYFRAYRNEKPVFVKNAEYAKRFTSEDAARDFISVNRLKLKLDRIGAKGSPYPKCLVVQSFVHD